ncbi:hypothetical protein DFJ73DRAFT_804618 [Zopfochytrium polystomum]|nr:hypothetical protein DFJ73DRAFT_804618 [Zopfochytrium polystomum]
MTTTTMPPASTAAVAPAPAASFRLLPAHVLDSIIGDFLPPDDRLRAATLLRLPAQQASSFRALHPDREFDAASARNDVALLDLLWSHCRARGLQPGYTRQAIAYASANGHLATLRWWRSTAAEVAQRFAADGVQSASARGQVGVLEWWRKESGAAGLDDHGPGAVDEACFFGSVEALQWWKDSGLEMQYSFLAIEYAAKNGHLNVLRWWKNSGLKPKLYQRALIGAMGNGHVEVLDFWLEERMGHVHVLLQDAAGRRGLEELQGVSVALDNRSIWDTNRRLVLNYS